MSILVYCARIASILATPRKYITTKHRARPRTAGYGIWMSVCTLIVISHWPLRRTQMRAAR